jgi:hypothetical protein
LVDVIVVVVWVVLVVVGAAACTVNVPFMPAAACGSHW